MTNKMDKWAGTFTSVAGNRIYIADIGDTFEAVQVPIGSILGWHKTFITRDSGTTTSTSAGHLVEAGQNFSTTVHVGNIVFNSTDSVFAYVTAVNSNTDLTLSADIIPTGKAYTIYSTPRLPDAWIECNGQAISNSLSAYNGGTAPSLNGTTDATDLFLRGVKTATTGATGGAATINLAHSHGGVTGSFSQSNIGDPGAQAAAKTHTHSISSDLSSTQTIIPPYVSLTWIMRIY